MTFFKISNGDKELNKISAFSISRTMGEVIDSFSVSFGNPTGQEATYVYLADTLFFLKDGVEKIFTGIVETKESDIGEIESRFTVSGRDSIADLWEDAAEFNTYKNQNDNDIIRNIIEGGGLSFDLSELGTATKISEYTVGPGDTVGSAVIGIAQMNGYSLWRKGDKLIKGRLKEEGSPVKTFEINEITNRSDVLGISIYESIREAKTEIQGFSASGNKEKYNLKVTNIVPNFGDTNFFQRKIRKVNGYEGSSSRINRVKKMSMASKNQGDLQREVELEARKNQVKATMTITVKNFQDLELNDIIGVKYLKEGIDNTFVVTGLKYSMENSGRETTEIVLTYKGAYPQ